MLSSEKISPRDVGLPEPVIRKRRRSRRLAGIMLTVALITAIAGWSLFGTSIFNAIHIKDQPASLALIAYALLIVSSATLVLGLWYLLLAQMERLAHIVEAPETGDAAEPARCPGCHCLCDSADRFCRHCGKALTS